MSAREWKPGDVAMVVDRSGASEIGFCYHGGVTNHGTGPDTARWRVASGEVWSSVAKARPLVVIDPEGREQVKRLTDWMREHGWTGLDDEAPDDMAEALREFANPTPPKPEEPTGLGAVVEDADGHKFVRVADPIDGWAHGRQWQRIGGEINAVRNFGWPQVNAVRVLSEGVTA